ncbi:hypothetical protein KC316_g710 [Hortaea werneckii]|nr:hypothetical protein KC324_g801 [Hortaea werneckii]KAI7595148.1 hypothetical protein KC316_g710 [Hortaea werneckii]
MSHDQNDVLIMTLSEKPSTSDEMAIMRNPSDDSQNDLLPPKPLEPRAAPATPAHYDSRLDRERSVSQAPPRRHPSRQVMRWAPPPPPSEYIWDDERQPHRARTSFDYSGVERGVPVGPPSDYYYHDFYHEPYYSRRYRPQMSSHPPPTLPDGPPGPPPPPPRRPHRSEWDDSSDDEDAAAAVSRNSSEVKIGIVYFDSKTMSDVTVLFQTEHGTCSISAHKIVLAQSSDFFKKAFIGNFKEAASAQVRLHDDDPRALFGLVGHCYGLHYDGSFHYSKSDIPIDCNDDGAAYIQHRVNVYVVADKYGVVNLCNEIRDKLPDMLDRIVPSMCGLVKGYPTHLDQIARHIYLVHPVAAKQLRKPIVDMFAKHVKSWVGTQEFERLVLDLPEFAVELFRALAGEGTKQGTTAGAGKGKRGQRRRLAGEV